MAKEFGVSAGRGPGVAAVRMPVELSKVSSRKRPPEAADFLTYDSTQYAKVG